LDFLVDTNVLIDLYRGRLSYSCAKTISLLFESGRCYISIISQAELLSHQSLTEAEKQFIDLACSKAILLDITSHYLQDVVFVRGAKKIKLPDAILAGMARNHKLTVLTANVNDFLYIPGVNVAPSSEIDTYHLL
jgi:predicted nucleic acid-binding protein